MCGIAGFVNLPGKLTPQEIGRTVSAMTETMVHHAPDDSGAWVDSTGYCGLGQRRLSIIDTSPAGH